jgi:predicted outer membrane repeat protein
MLNISVRQIIWLYSEATRMNPGQITARLMVMAAVLIAALALVQQTQAATLTVNSNQDTIDVAGGNCAAVTTALLQADDDRTVREAICAANNNGAGSDTITFAAGLPPILLTSDLPDVTSSITFAGANDDSTLVDGQDTYRSGFEFSAPVKVIIRDMTFEHGFTGGGGGAFSVGNPSADLQIERSQFNDNTAAVGGAVSGSIGGAFKVTDSVFRRNRAQNQIEGGGAIMLQSPSSINLSGSIFEGNSTVDRGGALFVRGLPGQLIISDTRFHFNQADEEGGALHITGDLGGLQIKDGSHFVGNQSGFNGGAISVGGGLTGKLTISDSILYANSVIGAGFGGFLYVAGSNTTASVTIKDSNVTGNTSAGAGGAFWIDGTVTKLTIQGSSIEGNVAGETGGGFRLNTVNEISIKGGTMAANAALDGDGGVLFVSDTGSVKINDLLATDNTADEYGGAFYLDNLVGNLSIKTSTFSANEAGYSGGALRIYAADDVALAIKDSTFDQNQSTDDNGGAVALSLSDASTVSISKSVFTDNSANVYGGAIHMSGGTLTVKTTTFARNASASSASGAALYLSRVRLFMNNSLIDSNNASAADQAAIRFASPAPGGSGILKNNCFENNTDLAISDLAGHVATRNWWGDAGGPGGPDGTNPSGDGYEADSPNATPWLTVRPKCGAP